MRISDAASIYVGSQGISKAYLGSLLVWTKEPLIVAAFDFLVMDADFETQFVLSGNNPLWQYTSLKGGL